MERTISCAHSNVHATLYATRRRVRFGARRHAPRERAGVHSRKTLRAVLGVGFAAAHCRLRAQRGTSKRPSCLGFHTATRCGAALVVAWKGAIVAYDVWQVRQGDEPARPRTAGSHYQERPGVQELGEHRSGQPAVVAGCASLGRHVRAPVGSPEAWAELGPGQLVATDPPQQLAPARAPAQGESPAHGTKFLLFLAMRTTEADDYF